MLRLVLACALGALLFSSTPLSAQTAPDVLEGRMRGTWDLPVKDQPGRARGVLLYIGEVMVGMDARLTPFTDGTVRGGRIDGILRRRTDTGFAPEPMAEVHGTYVIGIDGRGRFEAMIVPPAPIVGIRPEPIGKMGGVFYDPMMRDSNPTGRFMGRWVLWI